MTTDQKSGAGAYKSDRNDAARPPYHLHLGGDRHLEFGYREAAIAAGALGLGFLAYKGVKSALGRTAQANARAAGHTGHLEPVPLASSARSDVKDNAAPRFYGDQAGEQSSTPFVAASSQDDTGNLLEQPTSTGSQTDQSAGTAEHVPTDLMGDQPPTANDRAIDAFRPDATAPVPEAMRDSLRPATGPAPSLASDRGTFAQGLSQTDGSK